jgi:hypothetical protein
MTEQIIKAEPQKETRGDLIANRLSECSQCPHLTDLSVCRSCGCYMPVKVLFKGVTCPEGRW